MIYSLSVSLLRGAAWLQQDPFYGAGSVTSVAYTLPISERLQRFLTLINDPQAHSKAKTILRPEVYLAIHIVRRSDRTPTETPYGENHSTFLSHP